MNQKSGYKKILTGAQNVLIRKDPKYDVKLINKAFDIKEKLEEEDKQVIENLIENISLFFAENNILKENINIQRKDLKKFYRQKENIENLINKATQGYKIEIDDLEAEIKQKNLKIKSLKEQIKSLKIAIRKLKDC